ncbi:hypothetical protein [Polaromonas glacialis]|nr:hypothetical protein [Polaromonas glacialis]
MNSFTAETTHLAGVPGLAGAGERTGSVRVCKVVHQVTEAVADTP